MPRESISHIEQFRETLRGQLIQPGDPEYDDAIAEHRRLAEVPTTKSTMHLYRGTSTHG